MNKSISLVVFGVSRQRYAILLRLVERVVRAVEVTPLPNTPFTVLGMIDVEGRTLPVFSLRRRLQFDDREILPQDQFIIASTSKRSVVLAVDEVEGVIERPELDIIDTGQVSPGAEEIAGAIRLEGELVLICDLERFLSEEESRAVESALDKEAVRAG